MEICKKLVVALVATTIVLSSGCGEQYENANVDDARLLEGAPDGADWLSYGRTYDEQRFSPLKEVTDKNVDKLGLQWSADLDTARGQEATPIVVDGVIYISTAWSMVKAYNAATGEPLWEYDPEVPRAKLVDVCCDAVNRGVAVYKGKVYVGTLDGRLVALDADTGAVVWDKMTIPEGSQMAITGAPRVAKGKVLIGSAGGEYMTRGYLAAFDAETGEEAWRFYTVPGDPSKPQEGKHLEVAKETWAPDAWKYGGGGNVWDSITYDSKTDLVFFGTANAEPWNPKFRGTNGGGDSLYTSSIVAVEPDTGEYVWHFQETPEDRWDFDSNQQIIVADIELNGKLQHVIMHAPKNGFFYVLDAATGKFLSGKPFADKITWASGLDPKTGKPIVNPEAKYEQTGEMYIGFPGGIGAHSWTPMSYSPDTGLVYIPTNEVASPYLGAADDWEPGEVGFQLGLEFGPADMPAEAAIRAAAASSMKGALLAWDPVAGKKVWEVEYPGPSNGGTLATAGNLIFQGTAAGEFRAYTADTGKQLWSFPTQTGVIAAPIAYAVNGEQYVAIVVGWGGVWDVAGGKLVGEMTQNISRLLVFKIGGDKTLPPPPPSVEAVLDPPPFIGTLEQATDGRNHYANSCSACHGASAVAGTINPDIRHSSSLGRPELWQQIVNDGLLADNGMAAWKGQYTVKQIDNIRHYVIKRANEDKALELATK